eukprot:TRINITY_DN13717_c0_g1_i1.p1 TRINITY_DN13717_c0_g1~~TRINITY_DN13717_c0_g1_i1.p1  ORF type:complete len:185 (-),score=34.66 TRINITY_DN13717_c0_g1_i1:28-582(-)
MDQATGERAAVLASLKHIIDKLDPHNVEAQRLMRCYNEIKASFTRLIAASKGGYAEELAPSDAPAGIAQMKAPLPIIELACSPPSTPKPHKLFSPSALRDFNAKFAVDQNPTEDTITELADKHEESLERVKVWFDNRRTRSKRALHVSAKESERLAKKQQLTQQADQPEMFEWSRYDMLAAFDF